MAKRRRRKSSSWFNSRQANLVATLLGMMTTITLGLTAYEAWKNPEHFEHWWKTTDVKPASSADASGRQDGMDVSGGLKSTYGTLEKILDSNDPRRITTELVRRNQKKPNSNLSIRLEESRQRMQLAEKLIEFPAISEKSRVLAIESIFSALQDIYQQEIDFDGGGIGSGKRLKDIAVKYQDDSNERIVRIADLTASRYDLFEAGRNPQEHDADQATQQLIEVLKKQRNDVLAVSFTNETISQLWKLNRPFCSEVLQKLLDAKSQFAGTAVGDLLDQFWDRRLLAENQYVRQYENRWANGGEGRQKMLETSIEMLKQPDSSLIVVGEANKVAAWFTRNGFRESGQEIYQCMLDSAESRTSEKARKQFERFGNDGLKRANMLDHPFAFAGKTDRGDEISGDRFESMIVAVVFWSLRDPGSTRFLTDLHRECVQFASMPIRFVTICVDRSMGSKHREELENLPRFDNAFPETGRSPMLEQFPVDVVPHIILVNHKGIVANTDVTINKLATELHRLASMR